MDDEDMLELIDTKPICTDDECGWWRRRPVRGMSAYFCRECNCPITDDGDCGCGRGSYYFEDDDL